MLNFVFREIVAWIMHKLYMAKLCWLCCFKIWIGFINDDASCAASGGFANASMVNVPFPLCHQFSWEVYQIWKSKFNSLIEFDFRCRPKKLYMIVEVNILSPPQYLWFEQSSISEVSMKITPYLKLHIQPLQDCPKNLSKVLINKAE